MRVIFVLFGAFFFSFTIIFAEELPDWENPTIFGRNQVPAHTELIPFSTVEAALERNREASPFFASLNGTWKFRWFQVPEEAPDFYREEADLSGWDGISVPGNWQMQGYGHPMFRNVAHTFHSDPPRVPDDYNPVGCYRRDFELPADWTSRRVFLHFEGVKSASYVWVNGKKVGYNEGGMTAAEYDITDYIRPGTNSLAVQVFRYSDGTYLEAQDMWRLSGIYRDVYLFSAPEISLRDAFIQTRFSSDYTKAVLTADIELAQPPGTALPAGLRLESRLFEMGKGEVWDEPFGIEEFSRDGETIRARLQREVPSPSLWSAEKPNLYTLVLQLVDPNGLLQTSSVRFGFRQVEIRDRQIWINGKTVKFNGVNRHEHHPRTGRMMTRETMEEDLILMKRFNINLVRTSHYPPDPEFLDLADEYGIYVVDEVNDEAHANRYLSGDPAWKEAYFDRTRGMVLRDRNHPSVIFWSAGNESGTGENLADLIRLGKELDPSRPGWMYGATSTTRDQPFEEIIGPRYPPPDRLERIARVPERQDPRPSFMDEYISASGNSLGHFEEYWSLINRYPRLTGGAIWDWVSPGIIDRVRMAADHSGNGNQGYILGRAASSEGRLGRGLALSGRDEWVEFYRSPSLDLATDRLAVSLWIAPRNWTGTGPLITKGARQFGLVQRSPSEIAFYVQTDEQAEVAAPLPDDWQDEWHHVAGVYTGEEILLYLDGRAVGRRPLRGRIAWTRFPVAVGKDVELHGQNHEGPLLDARIDEVRLYGQALTAEELAAEFRDPGSLTAEGLLAHLDFEAIEEGDEFYSLGIGARTYGLVWPDRQVQPELWQVKKTPQPVRIEPVNLLEGKIRITNRHLFTSLQELEGSWEVREDGEVLSSGSLDLDLPPGESRIISIDHPAPRLEEGREYWLLVRFSLREKTRWADAGHDIAWEQLRIPYAVKALSSPGPEASDSPPPPLELDRQEDRVVLRGSGFEYAFDQRSGRLASLVVGGRELLAEGLRPNFWRAPTSNEMDDWRNPPIADWWFPLGLDRLEDACTFFEAIRVDPSRVRVQVRVTSSAEGVRSGFDSRIRYEILGSGEIFIDHHVSPWGEFPQWREGVEMWLPRIGLQLKLAPSYKRLAWYGRGPFENYPDRLTGAQIALHETSVEEDYVGYLFPQDYGNRSEVRWLSVSDDSGTGLMAVGRPHLNFSAHPYDVDNLTRANYVFQLVRDDAITLNLDSAVTGVGGTPVPTLPKYRVPARPHRYSLLLRPFSGGRPGAAEIARQVRAAGGR